jgi:translation initiation factor 4A
VLDEADEMLSSGFKEQIYNIYQYLPDEVQVAIFSATLPTETMQMTSKFMQSPITIKVKSEDLNLECIQQFYVSLSNDDTKYDMLKHLYENLSVSQSIVYANSVKRVDDLTRAMEADGFSVSCIHSNMPSEQRKRIMQSFRTGNSRVLISSDLTARGMDVQQVNTVINFDLPRCVHNYLHRIGRSGRWGRKGVAINFITRQDIYTLKTIEEHYKSTIKELPANFKF